MGESIWQRTPNSNIPGIPDEDDHYDRPGDVKSVPRDGRPKNLNEPGYGWQRNPAEPENSAYSQSPSFDWSAQKAADDFELTPVAEEEPFYDWAGGRPTKLRSTPQGPDMDWSANKPDSAWYKKEEPQYDWSGARPEGPFDRPSVTAATESDDDLELAAIL